MSEPREKAAHEAAQSYLDWWRLAGVDTDYVTDAGPWLDADPDRETAAEKPEAVQRPPDTAAQKPSRQEPSAADRQANMPDLPPPPDTHAEFMRYWMEEAKLALPSGTGRRAAPHGPLQPRLMIVADMPDTDDTGMLFSGAAGHLLKKILSAAAIDADTVYHASLLPEHLLEPRLDAAVLAAYGDILNAHIGFVRPQNVMLLGEMPNSALTGNDLAKNRLSLRIINHELGEMVAASSFHPRTLLQRPSLKARAWQDWQWLMENMT